MTALNLKKYGHKHASMMRDARPFLVRMADAFQRPTYAVAVFVLAAACLHIFPWVLAFGDLVFVLMALYFWWLMTRSKELCFKLPMGAGIKDPHNEGPGRSGEAEGILYLGNNPDTGDELWFTNNDARTHILYLGTTGSGKTEGLKSIATNALAWGSGFVYVDGKADTDLWSSISAMVRRFGRDDDLLVLNYMTGNSQAQAPSNTMNPFSSGSASYLVNMLVELMPESEGDNAMWKERAVALCSAMMPVLVWKRDHQDMPMSVRTIRDYLSLNNVIKLFKDQTVPFEVREGLKGYLETLPGYVEDAFDDEGKPKPPGPDTPQYDTTTASQQHGYLAMQFTRALQSLGDDYGYIFDTQAADVDMMDVVLNRRILIVLIPALEKSGDEIANLGKIVAATMKGMMGSTLGSDVEGTSEKVIENKPTHSSTPFITIFDEVGYYTAQGMAVMAAQARSLGFCLVFSGQDIPAMKKRVREEANSITANCNIKIFGKLEDPTDTKDFFKESVGTSFVTEVSTFQMAGGSEFGSYLDNKQAGLQERGNASYDGLRTFKEGEAVITFGGECYNAGIFYSNPGKAKAMRVTRYMALPPPDDELVKHAHKITELRDLLVSKSWTAMKADVAVETPDEIKALKEGYKIAKKAGEEPVLSGVTALVEVHTLSNPEDKKAIQSAGGSAPEAVAPSAPVSAPTPPIEPDAVISPPEAPIEAPAQEAAPASPPAEAEAKPFSMFGPKSTEAPQQPAAPQQEQSQPVPEQTPADPSAASPEAQPDQSVPSEAKKKLPPEIEAIIHGAALDARKTIFKDKENS